MRVFDLIRAWDADVAPEKTKVHLAGWNGEEDPLQVYLAGGFDAWQSVQSRRNF